MKSKRFAILTFIFAMVMVPPAIARDAYVECVQKQLTHKGYDPGVADGLMGPKTKDAWHDYTATLPQTERLTLLPTLKRKTAIHWCREFGHHDIGLRNFMPSRQVPVLAVHGPGAERAFDMAWRYVGGFFRSAYQIDIAGRIGVVLGENPTAISKILRSMNSELGLRLGGLDAAVKARCPKDKPGAAAYADRIFICIPGLAAEVERLDLDLVFTLTAIFAHEFAHIIQAELSGMRSSPYIKRNQRSPLWPHWLVEGSADHAMERYISDDLSVQVTSVERLFERTKDIDIPLKKLRKSGSVDEVNEYQVSLFAAHLLALRFGDVALFDYWRRIGAGSSNEEAFKETFGMELSAFESQFEILRKDVIAAGRFGRGE